jgi:hypothetical protein
VRDDLSILIILENIICFGNSEPQSGFTRMLSLVQLCPRLIFRRVCFATRSSLCSIFSTDSSRSIVLLCGLVNMSRPGQIPGLIPAFQDFLRHLLSSCKASKPTRSDGKNEKQSLAWTSLDTAIPEDSGHGYKKDFPTEPAREDFLSKTN